MQKTQALMDHAVLAEVASHFKALSSVIPLHPVRTEQDYAVAVNALNQLLDAGAADEQHPLADLANTLGALIGEYEDIQPSGSDVSPSAMLRFLMEQHGLTQSGLPEIGTQGVVSEILSGKRELNVRQIKALSLRFHVPASAFV